jgi:hypothetical protein
MKKVKFFFYFFYRPNVQEYFINFFVGTIAQLLLLVITLFNETTQLVFAVGEVFTQTEKLLCYN